MAEIITSEIEIQSGVISSGLTVDLGGEVTVLSGGTVTESEAANSGWFWVEEGGYISNIRVTNSGDAMVAGGSADNLTVESGGMADIMEGTLRGGTLRNNGYGMIYEGGSGFDVAVSAGGRYLVNGGYVENTVVSSGGSLTVQISGGLADKTTIEAGGHARITSDGQMWETILNGGRLDVISGTAKNTTINAGELYVSSGGPESGSGYAEGTVMNGGEFIVSGGATAKDTTVNVGLFTVSSDVTADGATVNAGAGMLVLSGGMAAAIRENGGYVSMEDGADAAFASNTFYDAVLTGMSATVHSGTTARRTTLNEDAVMRIYSGGEAYNTIMNGGILFATSATVGGITVSGGYASFESTAVSALALFGGTVFADSATVVSGAALNGGVFRVQSGTTVYDVEFNGADIIAEPGAVFSGAILKTGHMDIASGSMEDLIIRGGTLTANEASLYAITVDAGTADFTKSTVFNLTVNGGTVSADSATIITGATLYGGVLSIQSGTLVTACDFWSGANVIAETGAVFSHSFVRTGRRTVYRDFTAHDGNIYRTTALDEYTRMYVESGAVVTDVIAGKNAGLIVQAGAIVSSATAMGGTISLAGGTVTDVSLGKTALPYSSGRFDTPSVISYGNATVYTDKTASLHISSGGLAVGVYASNGDAYRGSEYVAVYVEDGGVASDMTIHQAAVYVSGGGVARGITISGYEMSPIGGYVTLHYPSWGKVVVLAGGLVEDIDLNQAILKVSGGTVRNLVASNWSVIDLSEGGVIGGALELTGSAKLTLGSNGGIIDFDISETAPGAAAVKKGLSNIEGAPVYTITVSGTQSTGNYHPAADSAAVSGTFTVQDTSLTRLGSLSVGESVLIGDLYYTLKMRNVNLDLVISTELPSLNDPYAVYVDSNWSDIPFGGIVELPGGGTATMGYDAFADGDEAVASVKADGTVYITGGAVSFGKTVARNTVVRSGATITGAAADYDAVVTVESGAFAENVSVSGNASLTLKSGSVCRGLNYSNTNAEVKVEFGATITGACYFVTSYEGITIDGTIDLDISGTGPGGVPLRSLTLFNGTPNCVITVDTSTLETRTYTLATDSSYKFGSYNYTLRNADGTVLGVFTYTPPSGSVVIPDSNWNTLEIGDIRYTLTYTRGNIPGGGDYGSSLTLSVEKTTPAPQGESYVYVNASWAGYTDGTTVSVTRLGLNGTQTAVIGKNAFASLDDALKAVSPEGTIGISGQSSGSGGGSFSPGGLIVIGESTVTTIAVSETGETTLIAGGTADTTAGETASGTEGVYTFPEGLPCNIDLTATARIENAVVQKTLSVENATAGNLTVVEGGSLVTVTGATCENTRVEAGGSFVCRSRYNRVWNLSVAAGGTFGMYNEVTPSMIRNANTMVLTGTCVFEEGADITVNGTIDFDISGTTAGGVMFDGLKYVKGNAEYRITVDGQQAGGLYHLAVNANEFADGIALYAKETSAYGSAGKLKVGEMMWFDGYCFKLMYADGALDLMVAAFEPQAEVYLNTDWAGLAEYSVVEVAGGTAVIGVDAFADLDFAMSACAEDGAIFIEGGTYALSGILKKSVSARSGTVLVADGLQLGQYSDYCTLTLDAGAAVEGNIIVSENSRIVLNGVASPGSITVNAKGLLSGRQTFTDDMDITVNGIVDFDISGTTAGGEALMQGLSRIKGAPTYSVTVDNYQQAGLYNLADDAAGFNGVISIRSRKGIMLGTLTSGKPVLINGVYYTVRGSLVDGKMQLQLLVGEKLPPETVYLSSDWRWTSEGTIVNVPGGTANFGYDAFYRTADAAEAAAFGESAIAILGGSYSFAADELIPGDVYLSGGTLSVAENSSRITGTVTVNQSGCLILEKGGAVYGAIAVNAGGSLTLNNGLAVSGMAFSDWGRLRLGNGSSASDITLVNNGSVKVDEGGFASNITFKTGFSDVYAGGSVSGATVTNDGHLTVQEGGTASDITVFGGNFNVESGGTISNLTVLTVASNTSVSIKGKLTGRCWFTEGTSITVEQEGTVDFGLSYTSVDGPALYEGFSRINCKGTPHYTLTVSWMEKEGDYVLATGVTAFDAAITVTSAYGIHGTVALGQVLITNGKVYTLSLNEQTLSLNVAGYVPPSAVYLSSAWAGQPDGKVVAVSGGTAVIGYDAFADADAAMATAGEDGTLLILGGTFSFTAGIAADTTLSNGAAVHDSALTRTLTVKESASAWNLQAADGAALAFEAGASAANLQVAAGGTLTVEAGAKLTGWAVFAEGADITVNGTIDFNVSGMAAGASALYDGLRYVQGDTTYTLTVSDAQATGFYYLAYGAGDFASAVTVVGLDGTALGTLKAGMSTMIGGVVYTLNLGGGILSLSVANATETNPRSDVDGNGVSDVLFQYTGGDNQTGYWMNGADIWRSENLPHPAEWTLLGAYDMDGDGIADSVFVGNGVEVDGVKGAYIGYYKGGVDTDSNWVNIHFLENEEGNVWANKIGNLTGNPDKNSIVWHCAGLGALGVWKDGTNEWVSLGAGFDSNWTLVGCGDFDGDGRDSVVMSYLGGVKYYAIGLDGSAVDMGALNWAGWEVRAIGDFKGDGKDDMVLFHKESGSAVMLADGSVDGYTMLGQLDASDWFIVGAGDYDGDRKDDLLVRQYSTGMLGYYSAGDTSKWTELGRGVDMDWTVIA